MPTALTILMPGFEELEAIAPIDLLRRADVRVMIASLEGPVVVEGRNLIKVQAEYAFDQVRDMDFDLVFLPGGPGHKLLRQSAAVLDLVRRQADSPRLLAAICAAPTVLHEAGVLRGRRFTGHASIAEELPALDRTRAVVRDGNLITSQGAGTAIEFGLALVEGLRGPEEARKVAASIHWQG